jgi:hypothetical protein
MPKDTSAASGLRINAEAAATAVQSAISEGESIFTADLERLSHGNWEGWKGWTERIRLWLDGNHHALLNLFTAPDVVQAWRFPQIDAPWISSEWCPARRVAPNRCSRRSGSCSENACCN